MGQGITEVLVQDAPHPHFIQIQNTIASMDETRNGDDIRSYSSSARDELLSAGTVNILKKDGETVIATVPKLSLVVVSSRFRIYLTAHPEATSIKMTQASLDNEAVAKLMQWVNDITNASDERIDIKLPTGKLEAKALSLIRTYYTAQALCMEQYLSHFLDAYKSEICRRLPWSEEIQTLEHLTKNGEDDMVEALTARLGYLRRTFQFAEVELYQLDKLFGENPKVGKAVQEADKRAEARR
jgi:hypothetical protein